jgi:hypothetical protein
MDSWFFNLSHCFNHTWVCIFIDFSSLGNILFFRIFVPQLAILPTDNSTSEWDNVKYLIDHFDSSSK